jgi:hypothetical protein
MFGGIVNPILSIRTVRVQTTVVPKIKNGPHPVGGFS